MQESITSRKRFKRLVKMVAFYPFKSAEQALSNLQSVSEGRLHSDCAEFLEMNLPSVKKSSCRLAVEDEQLPASIKETFPKLACMKNEVTDELFRGIRTHLPYFLAQFDQKDLSRAQLGLAHAYSRSKVQGDVKKQDRHILHSIALLDQLDKDINTFSMRVKEWFSWHFPELARIVTDNTLYARCVKLIENKRNVNEDLRSQLMEILTSEEVVTDIIEAAKISMGQDMTEMDSVQISLFTDKVISLSEFRSNLSEYLKSRMNSVAPNLSALIGDIVGARLIAQAGSLLSLAKYPASTVQILGAEKALFRALKTHSNTPKYGILYHSTFIGRAGMENKGKISRYLANKCSLASRIDAFYPTVSVT